MRKRLGTLPDLERILSRVHAANCKLPDFLSALGGFRVGQAIVGMLASHKTELRSERLLALVRSFPEMGSLLQRFETAFNHETALREGTRGAGRIMTRG